MSKITNYVAKIIDGKIVYIPKQTRSKKKGKGKDRDRIVDRDRIG